MTTAAPDKVDATTVRSGLRTPKAGLLASGVGAGLTLSALTDSCTMGRVLSALP